jgi:surface protein
MKDWDVSKITDMSKLFAQRTQFNQPLNNWNVSQVTNMSFMFWGCENFNQPLDSWDVSKVTDMEGMFVKCKAFNQSLDSWNVSKVTDMTSMFMYCTTLNQTFDNWKTENVTNMKFMFYHCEAFRTTEYAIQLVSKWKKEDKTTTATTKDKFYETTNNTKTILENVAKTVNAYQNTPLLSGTGLTSIIKNPNQTSVPSITGLQGITFPSATNNTTTVALPRQLGI